MRAQTGTPADSSVARPSANIAVLNDGSSAEIADWLGGVHYLEVIGFDDPDMDVEVVREIARAIHDMLIQYPDIEFDTVAIGDVPDGTFGRAQGDVYNRGSYTEYVNGRITFDRSSAGDLSELMADMGGRVARGLYSPAYRDRPVYAIIVHELFHALDVRGALRARIDADRILMEHYAAEAGAHPVFGLVGYYAWTRQLSGYSFLYRPDDLKNNTVFGELNNREAVAEAGLEVVVLGEAASVPAQLLHDAACGEAHAARGVEVRRGVKGEGYLPPYLPSDPLPGEMTDPSNSDNLDAEAAWRQLAEHRLQLGSGHGVEGVSANVGIVRSGLRRFVVFGVDGESEAALARRLAEVLKGSTDTLVREMLDGDTFIDFEWVSASGVVTSRRGIARAIDGEIQVWAPSGVTYRADGSVLSPDEATDTVRPGSQQSGGTPHPLRGHFSRMGVQSWERTDTTTPAAQESTLAGAMRDLVADPEALSPAELRAAAYRAAGRADLPESTWGPIVVALAAEKDVFADRLRQELDGVLEVPAGADPEVLVGLARQAMGDPALSEDDWRPIADILADLDDAAVSADSPVFGPVEAGEMARRLVTGLDGLVDNPVQLTFNELLSEAHRVVASATDHSGAQAIPDAQRRLIDGVLAERDDFTRAAARIERHRLGGVKFGDWGVILADRIVVTTPAGVTDPLVDDWVRQAVELNTAPGGSESDRLSVEYRRTWVDSAGHPVTERRGVDGEWVRVTGAPQPVAASAVPSRTLWKVADALAGQALLVTPGPRARDATADVAALFEAAALVERLDARLAENAATLDRLHRRAGVAEEDGTTLSPEERSTFDTASRLQERLREHRAKARTDWEEWAARLSLNPPDMGDPVTAPLPTKLPELVAAADARIAGIDSDIRRVEAGLDELDRVGPDVLRLGAGDVDGQRARNRAQRAARRARRADLESELSDLRDRRRLAQDDHAELAATMASASTTPTDRYGPAGGGLLHRLARLQAVHQVTGDAAQAEAREFEISKLSAKDVADGALASRGISADELVNPLGSEELAVARARANAAWWRGLSDIHRQRLIEVYPRQVGNSEGIPPLARHQANSHALQRYLAIRDKLAAKRDNPDSRVPLNSAEGDYIERMNGIEAALDEARAEAKRVGVGGPYLLAFDPTEFGGSGRAIVGFGADPYEAHKVSWYVPGMTVDISKLRGVMPRALNQLKSTMQEDPNLSAAAICYIGYSAPGAWDPRAASPRMAKIGGEILYSDVSGFNAGRDTWADDGNHFSRNDKVVHSYGSVAASFFGQDGRAANDIRSVTYVGSPGAGPMENAGEWGIGDNVWVLASSRDGVTWLGGERPGKSGRIAGRGQGPDPAMRSWKGRRGTAEFPAEMDHRGRGSRSTHSTYWDYIDDQADPPVRTESLANIGRILAGHPERVDIEQHRTLEERPRRLGKQTERTVEPAAGRPLHPDGDPNAYHPTGRRHWWNPRWHAGVNCAHGVADEYSAIYGREVHLDEEPTRKGVRLRALFDALRSRAQFATYAAVQKKLENLGVGSSAVLGSRWARDGSDLPGHTYFARNIKGKIFLFDPNTGQYSPWPPYWGQKAVGRTAVGYFYGAKRPQGVALGDPVRPVDGDAPARRSAADAIGFVKGHAEEPDFSRRQAEYRQGPTRTTDSTEAATRRVDTRYAEPLGDVVDNASDWARVERLAADLSGVYGPYRVQFETLSVTRGILLQGRIFNGNDEIGGVQLQFDRDSAGNLVAYETGTHIDDKLLRGKGFYKALHAELESYYERSGVDRIESGTHGQGSKAAAHRGFVWDTTPDRLRRSLNRVKDSALRLRDRVNDEEARILLDQVIDRLDPEHPRLPELIQLASLNTPEEPDLGAQLLEGVRGQLDVVKYLQPSRGFKAWLQRIFGSGGDGRRHSRHDCGHRVIDLLCAMYKRTFSLGEALSRRGVQARALFEAIGSSADFATYSDVAKKLKELGDGSSAVLASRWADGGSAPAPTRPRLHREKHQGPDLPDRPRSPGRVQAGHRTGVRTRCRVPSWATSTPTAMR